jgi:hypothetical protein
MFEIKKRKTKLILALKEECKISTIQECYDRLVSSLKKDKVTTVEVVVDENAEIDTSYLQLLLSLKVSGIEVKYPEGLKSLGEVARVYGITLN